MEVYMHKDGKQLRLGFTTTAKKLYFFTDLTLGGFHAFYKEPLAVPAGIYYDAFDNPVSGQELNARWGQGESFFTGPSTDENRTELEQFYRWDSHPLYFNFSINVGYRF